MSMCYGQNETLAAAFCVKSAPSQIVLGTITTLFQVEGE